MVGVVVKVGMVGEYKKARRRGNGKVMGWEKGKVQAAWGHKGVGVGRYRSLPPCSPSP